MSSNEKSKPTRSDPIPISMHNRSRSLSVSSRSSSDSASSSSPNPQTPSPPKNLPSSSPILSFFIAQSPTTSTFSNLPFKRKFGTTPVLSDYKADEGDNEIPVATHARRASATVANRFSQSQSPTTLGQFPDSRGTNLLNLGRRLSLSSATFVKPQLDTTTPLPAPPPGSRAPPPTAVSPRPQDLPFSNKPQRTHRSETISCDGGKPRRAPSPMGERILKGHFDGFN